MIVTIHQPEHLPYAGFWDKIRRANALVLLDNVNFEKNYFQNRNRIAGPYGFHWITVPVENGTRLIKDTHIDQVSWTRIRKKNLKSIEQAYCRTKYFREYFPEFEAIYSASYKTIAEMNTKLLVWLLEVLLVRTLFKEFVIFTASHLPARGTKSELLANICRELSAKVYLAGTTAREYLEQEYFDEKGIRVHYHQFNHPVYTQLGNTEFYPFLSIIDMLFNCGGDTMKIIEAVNK